MAKPLTVGIKLPLAGNTGWIQLDIHVDDLDDLSAEDEKFILELMDGLRALAGSMREAGLLAAGPDLVMSGDGGGGENP
jgi:hypothetical protein